MCGGCGGAGRRVRQQAIQAQSEAYRIEVVHIIQHDLDCLAIELLFSLVPSLKEEVLIPHWVGRALLGRRPQLRSIHFGIGRTNA